KSACALFGGLAIAGDFFRTEKLFLERLPEAVPLFHPRARPLIDLMAHQAEDGLIHQSVPSADSAAELPRVARHTTVIDSYVKIFLRFPLRRDRLVNAERRQPLLRQKHVLILLEKLRRRRAHR